MAMVAPVVSGAMSTISIDGPAISPTSRGPGSSGSASGAQKNGKEAAQPSSYGITIVNDEHSAMRAGSAAPRQGVRFPSAGTLIRRSPSPARPESDGSRYGGRAGGGGGGGRTSPVGPGEVVGHHVLYKYDPLDLISAQAQSVRLYDQMQKAKFKQKDDAQKVVSAATLAGLHLDTAESPSSKANSFTMPLIYDRQHAVLEKQRMANYRVTRGDAREMSAKHGGGGGGSRHRSGTAGSRRRRQRSQSAPVPQFIRNLRSPEPAEEEVLQDVLVARGSPPKGSTVATATAAATVKGSLSGEGAGGPGYGGYSNSLDGKRIRAPAHRNAGGPVPRGAGPILQPAWSVAKIQNPNEAAEATSDTLGYALGVDTSGTSLGLMLAPTTLALQSDGGGGGGGGGSGSGPAIARMGTSRSRGDTRGDTNNSGSRDYRAASSPPSVRTPHHSTPTSQTTLVPRPGYGNAVAGKVFMPTRKDNSPFRSRLVVQKKDQYEDQFMRKADGMFPIGNKSSSSSSSSSSRAGSKSAAHSSRLKGRSKSSNNSFGTGTGAAAAAAAAGSRPGSTVRFANSASHNNRHHRRAHSAPYGHQLRQQSASSHPSRRPTASTAAAATALDAAKAAAARADEPTYLSVTGRGGSAAPAGRSGGPSGDTGINPGSNPGGGTDLMTPQVVLMGNPSRFVPGSGKPSAAAAATAAAAAEASTAHVQLPAINSAGRGGEGAQLEPTAHTGAVRGHSAGHKVLTVPTAESDKQVVAGAAVRAGDMLVSLEGPRTAV